MSARAGVPGPARRAVLGWLARMPIAAAVAWLAGVARAQEGAEAASVPPRAIHPAEDRCPACGMAIVDARFAAQARDAGGRTLVYDAIECLADHRNGHAGPVPTDGPAWLADRAASTAAAAAWLGVDAAVVLHHPRLRTPMGGGLAAFADVRSARAFADANGLGDATVLAWDEVMALGVDRPWVPVL